MALTVPAPSVTSTPVENPIVVIGEHFVAPYPIDLLLQQKTYTLAENNYDVTDVQGNIVFQFKGKHFSLHDRRVMRDANGGALVSLRQKIMTAHRRWQVFRGESNSPSDLLFSLKKTSVLQFRTNLDVFLAGNTSESNPDFTIRSGMHESGCTIHAGENVIAQMHRNYNMESLVFKTDSYALTVCPNVDYAFITSLVVLLDEINDDRKGKD